MEQIKQGYFEGTSIESLTRTQLKAAILYIDRHIEASTESNQVIQYCIMKVDLINVLMTLDKIERRNFLG